MGLDSSGQTNSGVALAEALGDGAGVSALPGEIDPKDIPMIIARDVAIVTNGL